MTAGLPYGTPEWVTEMGSRWHVRTYEQTDERNRRTQQTNATKTQAENLLFLTVRVGLWITRISRQGVA